MSDRNAWVEAGSFEEAPRVFRIPLPLPSDGLKAVNAYAIADSDGVVMIDSGWALPESEQRLRAGLETAGFDLADVREFLITHVHRDHYAQAIALRRTFGFPVSLGEGEQTSLWAARRRITASGSADSILDRAGAPALAEQARQFELSDDVRRDFEDPDHWLRDGQLITLKGRTLRVIATPGHTAGHVVFYDAEAGQLFAGDHILSQITPSIGFQPAPAASPLRDYLNSLRLILALPDSRLFPAHGPVTESTHARVEELLAHHEERLTIMAEAVSAGASTAFEVARAIPWTRRLKPFDDLDGFNQTLAVLETMSHVVLLVERGWLTRTELDGAWHFARA